MGQPTQLTIGQTIDVAHQAGFTGGGLLKIVAIAMAESSLATRGPDNVNPDGSRDRGILQINSRWHPEVADNCAYFASCAFAQAYRISAQGTNFGQWSTYNNGAYLKKIPQVKTVVDTSNTNNNAPWWQQLIQALAPYSNLTPDVQNHAAAGAQTAAAKLVTDPIQAAIMAAFQPFFDKLPGFGVKAGLFMGALMILIIGLWTLTRNPVTDTNSAFTQSLNNSAKSIGSTISRKKAPAVRAQNIKSGDISNG